METSVKLKEKSLPPEFKDKKDKKVGYDEKRRLLILKGVMSLREKDELLGLSQDLSYRSYRRAIETLFQKSQKKILNQLSKLEEDITRYGEIFVETPDVWCANRLIEYKKTRDEDLNDMRQLYKEELQATFKESRGFGVAMGVGGSDKPTTETAIPKAPEKVAENLSLPPQERFRSKSTFLAEVELQKLVEGRDDNSLLQGYTIYLLRLLVSVVPGKRYLFFPSWSLHLPSWFPSWLGGKQFDSRYVYAEVSIRLELPEVNDLVRLSFIKKETSVILRSLPADVQPDDLSKYRVRYDAPRQLLVLKGIIKKEEKDELLKLSDDTQYRQAVGELFQRYQKADKDASDYWEEKLRVMDSRRKPYIYNFIPQEYTQHIGAWSAIGRKYGLDFSYPFSSAEDKGKGDKGKESTEGEKKQDKEIFKARALINPFPGALSAPPISASVLKAYNAESEAILSHQTLISFMRGNKEVGWLFGPRLVGSKRPVPEKGVRQLYVLVAAPGELPLVRLTYTTNWLNTKDLSKKAFNNAKVHELLERYYYARAEVEEHNAKLEQEKQELREKSTGKNKWEINWIDASIQDLSGQVDKIKFLMPIRTGKLLLPHDADAKDRVDETGIRDITPVITHLLPSSGPRNIGTQVLIAGRNFDYQARVEVDGKDILTVTLINRGLLLTTIPPSKDRGSQNTATIRVVTALGVSEESKFTYTSPVGVPQITNIKPEHPNTAEAFPVTISGYNFDSNTRILVDGKETNTDFRSDKELVARFPAGFSGKVKVYNPQGCAEYSFNTINQKGVNKSHVPKK